MVLLAFQKTIVDYPLQHPYLAADTGAEDDSETSASTRNSHRTVQEKTNVLFFTVYSLSQVSIVQEYSP